MLLLEHRQKALAEGGPALRPSPGRRSERLPLLVKYHKPAGVLSHMRSSSRKGVEDLRSVVSMAGDRFELDLYHPVGSCPTSMSGLLLWSRSGKLTHELTDRTRGVVHEFEAEVFGVVDVEKLREALSNGIRVGIVGFQTIFHADVRKAWVLPGQPLQDPRSRVVLATRDARMHIAELFEVCGYQVAQIRRTKIGPLSLDGLEEGGLAAATEEEEVWACRMGRLADKEYPVGALPPPRAPSARRLPPPRAEKRKEAFIRPRLEVEQDAPAPPRIAEEVQGAGDDKVEPSPGSRLQRLKMGPRLKRVQIRRAQ